MRSAIISVATEFMVSVAGVEGRLLRVIQKQTTQPCTLLPCVDITHVAMLKVF
jgi:hypothetical protein